MAFDFKRYLIKVQGGRQYLPVSARLIWFRQEHPDWGIETELLEINHEKQYALFRARIFNEENRLMAMGTKKEDIKGFGDYIEKAETGAVGRALALCGYGTQFSPELDEVGGGRFADSPQPMGGNRPNNGGSNSGSFNNGGNRYGGGSQDSSGTRFTPPRDTAPAPREDAPARPAVIREEAPPARVASSAPARRPVPAPGAAEEDDDFEALINGNAPEATEDDPFSEGASAPAAKAAPAPTGNGMPACISCGKALTKAQQDLSIRNYGEALCPVCQKDRSREERPVAAAR